jgi:hypothetical protein
VIELAQDCLQCRALVLQSISKISDTQAEKQKIENIFCNMIETLSLRVA